MSEFSAHAAIRARLDPLRAQSHAELLSLPASNTQVQIDGIEATLCTFAESQRDHAIWVVGQLSTTKKPFLVVFSSCQQFALGFEVRPDGSVRDLLEKELYDFT
jgi:hypothetical protein